jgi:uncharacterized protein HemY
MFANSFSIAALVLALVAPSEMRPLETARAFFSAGNYDEAISILLIAQHQSPENPLINYWLGRSYYEKQNYEQAIAYTEQAAKTSQDAEYYRWLGRAYGAKAEKSHSFFLARKVKRAFETAVRLDPRNIPARRDLMQYLLEAPGIVGGDKDKAKEQVDSIATLDSLEGRLARAAFFATEKKWKQAEREYLDVLAQQPDKAEAYMEAADFFEGRGDADHLDRAMAQAVLAGVHDPRIDFYRAVVLVLRREDLDTAEALLRFYADKVPERSDYPSHNSALRWLRQARNNPGGNELSRSSP